MYMRKTILALFMAAVCAAIPAVAAEEAVFGPAKYDVKERYGRLNTYTATFAAKPSLYLVKVQNGEKPAEKTDYIKVDLNGQPLIQEARYPYSFIVCYVELVSENTLTIVLRDERPSGMRRPPPLPKNVIITVLPVEAESKPLRGSFGLFDLASIKDIAATFAKIKDVESRRLAMDAASLHLTAVERATAVRTLSDRKDATAEDYIVRATTDPYFPTEVRGEATLALAVLGNTKHIPLFIQGLMDPEDTISSASARALSFYPESQTGPPLTTMIEKLDPLRKSSTIRAIVEAGWKPVETVIALSASEDAYIADMAIGLLGSMRDSRATDHLLAQFAAAGQKRMRSLISALAETSNPRALEALLAMAADPAKRAGHEIDLGDALARMGGARSEAAIAEMARKAPSPMVENRLRNAYRRLTGKNL